MEVRVLASSSSNKQQACVFWPTRRTLSWWFGFNQNFDTYEHIQYNHTKFEQETQPRWPGTSAASGGPRFRNLSKMAKKMPSHNSDFGISRAKKGPAGVHKDGAPVPPAFLVYTRRGILSLRSAPQPPPPFLSRRNVGARRGSPRPEECSVIARMHQRQAAQSPERKLAR